MAPKVRIQDGERVLCFHGPLLYEAKCIKTQVKDKMVKHFIHYSGWNKNWDEWVPEGRVLKFNEANLQRQKELEKQNSNILRSRRMKAVAGNAAPPKKREGGERETRASTPTIDKQPASVKGSVKSSSPYVSSPLSSSQDSTASTSSEVPGLIKKKRSRSEITTTEPEEPIVLRTEVKINIPPQLKSWLVDDCDLIGRQKKLVQIPAQVTVDQIITDYIKYKQQSIKHSNKCNISPVVEATNGIREYFNTALGMQLLYKFERVQYRDVLSSHPDTPASSIYGSIHLLRLFVKIGGMVGYTPLDEPCVKRLVSLCDDFLSYFVSNSGNLFSLNNYVVASPEYHRRSVG